MTIEQQKKNLVNALNKIVAKYENSAEQNLVNHFFIFICELFPNIDLLEIEDFNKNGSYTKFLAGFQFLSSGESTLLYNLIMTLSNIRFNSLILLDEPEVHLHPNFITKFMEFLYKLLDKFSSFAIICTHSSFVVREVKSECVYVIDRKKDFFSIRNIGFESLGANAMTLANEIFENIDIQPYYIQGIKRMIADGYTEKEILNKIKSYEDSTIDIGLNSYIHYLCKEKNEKY